jgi:hypothetical protein
VLEVGDKLVINPGSIGQPRDGDPRASYAIIEDYKVELRRAEYPVEETVRVIQESGLPDVQVILVRIAAVHDPAAAVLDEVDMPLVRGRRLTRGAAHVHLVYASAQGHRLLNNLRGV